MGFHLARLGERLLPQSVLSLLLWPAAAAWGLTEAGKQRMALALWPRFPEAWRPDRARFLLRQSLGLNHARFLYLWPDRLPSYRWIKRCHLEGNFNLTQAQQLNRPIVFVSLHFGPFETLPVWLRAHGIAVTVLVGRPPPRRAHKLYLMSPPADVPLVVSVNEMYRIRQFLRPGQRLLILIDVDRGKQIQVPFDNHSFRMSTGAIRLAAMTNAEMIPCLMVERDTWDFAIHFGSPVPQRYLGRSPDMKAAATHLLNELLQVVTRYPSQCGHRLLSCITPMTAERSSEGVLESVSLANKYDSDE